MKTPRETFIEIVRHTPLVSIDLVVSNGRGEVLLGLRENEPARGYWFVPGGRICKDERIPAAFARITRDELGRALPYEEAEFLGVYEHLYDRNFADEPGFGTHYVVLAHRVRWPEEVAVRSDDQHRELRWWPVERMAQDAGVHEYTRVYAAALNGATRPLPAP